MMHMADVLRVFARASRGRDRGAGRSGRYWAPPSERHRVGCAAGRSGDGRACGVRLSVWRWRSRTGAWCCWTPRRHPDEPWACCRRSPSKRRRISTISCWTMRLRDDGRPAGAEREARCV